MKLNRKSHIRQRGVAIIVVLAMLGIVTLYVAANLRSLSQMKYAVKQAEESQIKRLASHPKVSMVVVSPNALAIKAAP